jgi:hypothetical protein
MFRYLRLKSRPEKVVPDFGVLTAEQLARNPNTPLTLRQINNLPENVKRRAYRNLLPPSLLTKFNIHPITWENHGEQCVALTAEPESGVVEISVHKPGDSNGAFFALEIADNAHNGIDLNLLLLNDPQGPYFQTDFDEDGQATLFGSLHRNLDEERRALEAGLAPGQVRPNLGASKMTLQQLEVFLATLGHQAYFLEPLTYASAWIFERRGFAYVRGHQLMDEIHAQFQPGGRLHQALDGSTPFRRPDQHCSVRGRAWAIHDGILETIDAHWNNLRMVKQIGRHARVDTFPGGSY